jgi:hypothetical protein
MIEADGGQLAADCSGAVTSAPLIKAEVESKSNEFFQDHVDCIAVAFGSPQEVDVPIVGGPLDPVSDTSFVLVSCAARHCAESDSLRHMSEIFRWSSGTRTWTKPLESSWKRASMTADWATRLPASAWVLSTPGMCLEDTRTLSRSSWRPMQRRVSCARLFRE